MTDWTAVEKCPACGERFDHETHYDLDECEHCGINLYRLDTVGIPDDERTEER